MQHKVRIDGQEYEHRTRRLVLEAWERLHRECLMPEAYIKTDAQEVGNAKT